MECENVIDLLIEHITERKASSGAEMKSDSDETFLFMVHARTVD